MIIYREKKLLQVIYENYYPYCNSKIRNKLFRSNKSFARIIWFELKEGELGREKHAHNWGTKNGVKLIILLELHVFLDILELFLDPWDSMLYRPEVKTLTFSCFYFLFAWKQTNAQVYRSLMSSWLYADEHVQNIILDKELQLAHSECNLKWWESLFIIDSGKTVIHEAQAVFRAIFVEHNTISF